MLANNHYFYDQTLISEALAKNFIKRASMRLPTQFQQTLSH